MLQLLEWFCRRKPYCWPGNRQLAAKFQASENTVQEILKSLEYGGIIWRQMTPPGKKLKRVRIWLLQRADVDLPTLDTEDVEAFERLNREADQTQFRHAKDRQESTGKLGCTKPASSGPRCTRIPGSLLELDKAFEEQRKKNDDDSSNSRAHAGAREATTEPELEPPPSIEEKTTTGSFEGKEIEESSSSFFSISSGENSVSSTMAAAPDGRAEMPLLLFLSPAQIVEEMTAKAVRIFGPIAAREKVTGFMAKHGVERVDLVLNIALRKGAYSWGYVARALAKIVDEQGPHDPTKARPYRPKPLPARGPKVTTVTEAAEQTRQRIARDRAADGPVPLGATLQTLDSPLGVLARRHAAPRPEGPSLAPERPPVEPPPPEPEEPPAVACPVRPTVILSARERLGNWNGRTEGQQAWYTRQTTRERAEFNALTSDQQAVLLEPHRDRYDPNAPRRLPAKVKPGGQS
ncbi:MAG: hypothetical protein NVSMB9_21350 [Isosphaeraceae bacterium]